MKRKDPLDSIVLERRSRRDARAVELSAAVVDRARAEQRVRTIAAERARAEAERLEATRLESERASTAEVRVRDLARLDAYLRAGHAADDVAARTETAARDVERAARHRETAMQDALSCAHADERAAVEGRARRAGREAARAERRHDEDAIDARAAPKKDKPPR